MPERWYRRIRPALQVLRHGPYRPPELTGISPEQAVEARRFFPRDKFFIYGHARSGTTLFARLIRLHPEVHCNWQAHFFTRPPLLSGLVADRQVREWLSRRSNRWNRGGDLAPVVLRAVADYILERDAEVEGARIVGDKSPSSLSNGNAVDNLYQIYPDARLLVIVRDPRDTLLSHRFQAFLDSPQTLTRDDLSIREAFRRDPAPFLAGSRSVFTEAGLRAGIAGWVRNVRETRTRAQALFAGAYRQLRFEDLLAEPVRSLRSIWEFLGASPPDEELEGQVLTEIEHNPDEDWQLEKDPSIARHIEKGEVGGWRNIFTPQDRAVFDELAADLLDQLGYQP